MQLLHHLRRIPTKLYNPETTLYQSRIIANGGSISAKSLDSIEKFVQDCKNANIWTKLLEVGVFAGTTLNAALVKLVVGSGAPTVLTNINFVTGDYVETGVSGGLAGDGATKYLNTGFAGTNLPDAGHLSCYLAEDIGASGNRAMLGVLAALDQYWLGSLSPATSADFRYGQTVGTAQPFGLLKGFYTGVRASSTSLRLFRNGGLVDANTTATSITKTSQPIYTHAYNSAGIAGGWLAGRISFYSIGQSFTDAEVLALHYAVRTLQYNLNRGVN